MRVCLLDAWSGDDEALVNSHQVAVWTRDSLEAAGVAVAAIEGDVDRARVEAALAEPGCDGFAYFGHGRERCLYRQLDGDEVPVALIDEDNLPLVNTRWFHAFACLSGLGLGASAAAHRIGCYVGYAVKVNVGWSDDGLPDSLRALLIELVTCASRLLARGERSSDGLRRAVREASDALLTWWDEHPDEAEALPHGDQMALQHIASTLHARLTMHGTSVRE